MKRIIKVMSVAALMAAMLTVGLAVNVALAAPGIKGCSDTNDAVENCQTGSPEVTAPAEGFGAVTSQRASTVHDIGIHSSNPTPGDDQPRKGVGNVARTDAGLVEVINSFGDPGEEDDVKDTGARTGDHGCLIGELDDAIGQDDAGVTDCTADPGNPDKRGVGRS